MSITGSGSTSGTGYNAPVAAYRYVVADVFTQTPLTGNQLAVFTDARGLDAGTMQALCLVNTTLGDDDHLGRGVVVCEKTLALYQLPDGRPFERHPDLAWLAPAERIGLAEDRRELFLLLAGARVRLAGGDRASLRGALALLDQAEALRGLDPSKALWLDRAEYRAKLGDEAEKGMQEALDGLDS